jgi:hypothetical protein
MVIWTEQVQRHSIVCSSQTFLFVFSSWASNDIIVLTGFGYYNNRSVKATLRKEPFVSCFSVCSVLMCELVASAMYNGLVLTIFRSNKKSFRQFGKFLVCTLTSSFIPSNVWSPEALDLFVVKEKVVRTPFIQLTLGSYEEDKLLFISITHSSVPFNLLMLGSLGQSHIIRKLQTNGGSSGRFSSSS